MISDHVAGTLSVLDRLVVEAVGPGGNWRDLPPDFPSKRIDQIREGAATGKGSRSTYYGRLRWDRPSYTISTFFSRPGNGCFIHPEAARLITIREAARLQTFPDTYRFSGRGRSRYVQVGNAVPPLLAYQFGSMFEPGPLVDLFCGAGGLSLGLEMAGFDLIAAVDNDTAAVETFERNRPGADAAIQSNVGDVPTHDVVMKEIARRLGSDGLQLLAGGPPCQGFSTAGNCVPGDERNRLVFAFVEAVARLRPRFLLMENVPALLFRRGSEVLRQVRQALDGLGYRTDVMIAHAEGYGVPQLRRRLFVLGWRDTRTEWPSPWLRIVAPAHLHAQPGGASASASPPGFTVSDAIGDLPWEEASSADDLVPYARPPASSFQRWARGDLATSALRPPCSADDECMTGGSEAS